MLLLVGGCVPPVRPTEVAGTKGAGQTTKATTLPALPSPTFSPLPTPTQRPTLLPAQTPVSPLPTPRPSPSPTATPLPTRLKPSCGMQIDPNTGDIAQVMAWVEGLGCPWIKIQVQWAILEQNPEEYRWVELDYWVDAAEAANLKLLLGFVDAPGWLRAGIGYNGPPEDPAEFRRLMRDVSSRYAGRVEAYELWNEPNLSREWYGAELDPAAFVALVAEGSQGVREGDPEAIVVAGAPGVTGIDDGEQAIDDRRFLREALDAGLAQWVDAIGVHPYGYANPPWERAADAEHAAGAWNDHPSFFFVDTMEDYRAILEERGLDLPLWPTEFGWPVAEGIRSPDLPEDFPYPYAAWIDEEAQGRYLVAAVAWMEERPWVGPYFVWNLNMSVNWGADRPEALYSLLRPDASRRPAYEMLRVHGPE